MLERANCLTVGIISAKAYSISWMTPWEHERFFLEIGRKEMNSKTLNLTPTYHVDLINLTPVSRYTVYSV